MQKSVERTDNIDNINQNCTYTMTKLKSLHACFNKPIEEVKILSDKVVEPLLDLGKCSLH